MAEAPGSRPVDAGGIDPAAVVAHLDEDPRAPVVAGPLPRAHQHPCRAGVSHRVHDRLLDDAQHLEIVLRAHPRRGREVARLPVEPQAAVLERGLEARARGAECAAERLEPRIERVDHEPHVRERRTHGRRHARIRASVPLDQREQRHELAAEAVVHLAHQPLALLREQLGALEGAPVLVAVLELAVLLDHPLLQVAIQRLAAAQGRGEADHQRRPEGEQHQRDDVGQEERRPGARAAELDQQIVDCEGERGRSRGEVERGLAGCERRSRSRMRPVP